MSDIALRVARRILNETHPEFHFGVPIEVAFPDADDAALASLAITRQVIEDARRESVAQALEAYAVELAAVGP